MLWQPRNIRIRMQIKLMKKAVKGETALVSLGPAMRMEKIPAIHSRPWEVWIPKSAWRSTRRASSTATPAMLFSEPNTMLKSVTAAKQNATTR